VALEGLGWLSEHGHLGGDKKCGERVKHSSGRVPRAKHPPHDAPFERALGPPHAPSPVEHVQIIYNLYGVVSID
jgi:hypothetical protein